MTDREALAVRVAQEVWGWKLDPTKSRFVKGGDGFKITPVYLCDISNEVFSWAGLGRTLEAMAERKYFPMFNPSRVDVMNEKMERMSVEFIYPAYSESDSVLRGVAGFQLERLVRNVPQFKNMLIEATHQAALEALEKKNG